MKKYAILLFSIASIVLINCKAKKTITNLNGNNESKKTAALEPLLYDMPEDSLTMTADKKLAFKEPNSAGTR